jgi:hypothetical protein
MNVMMYSCEQKVSVCVGILHKRFTHLLPRRLRIIAK